MILRAEGRGFNAGVDIKEMQNTEGFTALIDANRGCFDAFRAVYECAVPVMAAVNGSAWAAASAWSATRTSSSPPTTRRSACRGGARRTRRGHPPVAAGAAAHDAPAVLHRRHRRRGDPAPLRLGARGGSDELDEAALRVARDIAVKDTRVIRAAKEALNLIDVQRVNSSYRMEQGFTFELNLSGVSDEHRDAFAGTDKGSK